MKINHLLSLGKMFVVVAVALGSACVWSQSTVPASPATPQSAKIDEAKTPEKAVTETPAIDPDVKRWFLEQQKPRLPYNPQDVEVLTGRAREAERMAEYPNYGWGPWAPFQAGSAPFMNGQWRGRYSSPFFSQRFTLWGGARGLRGGAFLFGPTLFRPFSFGTNAQRPGNRRR